MNRWERSRRALLRDLGLGAACLPLLNAGRAHAASPPKLLIVAAIEGYRIPYWQPADGPLTAALPPSCAPLDPYRSDLLFLHDLANPGFGGCAQCGTNAYGTMYYGLGARPGAAGRYEEPNGPTADQVIARAVGSTSGRRSFHAGVQTRPSAIAAPGARACFWAGPSQPINPEIDPVKTYADLFGGIAQPDITKVLLERRSILDYVGSSLERFKNRLGVEDRLLVEGHLGALRDFEQQLQVASAAGCMGPAPVGGAADYPTLLAAFMAITVAVLRCGISRVATLQLSDATGTDIDFGFVPGIPARGTGYKAPYRNWSDLGHNPVLGGVDHKRIVDQFWMSQLAMLIAQLKAAPDGTGTLFDSTVILWGNNMQDGANRAAQKVPWLLAGSAGGYFKTGACLGGRSTTEVLGSLCAAMGATANPYGTTYPGLAA
jgi:hypothetical protein